MIERIENNRYRVNLSYCQQCGACVGICGKNAIEHSYDINTGLMQLRVDDSKCIKCGLCYEYCPARNDNQILDVLSYVKEKTYYLGYNNSDLIRKNSSSGGVARTIIIEGLKSGIFDAVYTLCKTNTFPFAEGTVYDVNNIPAYDDIPTSIYHTLPAAKNIKQIKECNTLLLVGTSCQISALRKYAKNKCKHLYTLCIFCKQQKTFESSRFIAKLAGVNIKSFGEIKSFAYRGGGWPGYCMFNGKAVKWGDAALMPFGKKLWTVPGCNVCGNPFGNNVDITVLDPWVINKTNNKGANVIVTHNKRADILLDSISNITKEILSYNSVEPALMLNDLKKKNEYIPFFRGQETHCKVKEKGEKYLAQRQFWASVLTKTPRLPMIIYKILFKLIIDKR